MSKTRPFEENGYGGSSGKSDKDIIAKEFKDVFEGLGCFEQAYHIELKSDAVPVCEPPRRVPFAFRESLKNKVGLNGRTRSDKKC